MAGLISATPDELRGCGQQFIGNSGDISQIVSQLDNLKNHLQDIWKGSSSEAFATQYEEMRPTMTKFIELVEDVGRQVNSVADALERADQDIASQIRG
jgi:WXG100 family type VII secretion target